MRRQPTWKLLVIVAIICLVIGYLVGRAGAEKKAIEKIEEVQELRRQSALVTQRAVLMSNRAGEELKKAMEDIALMFTWNESLIVE